MENEEIEGIFYSPELQKVTIDNNETYEIEKVLKNGIIRGRNRFL